MTNYSRTTLRELKKRYLNVLKKCFLINIGVLLFSTSVMAIEVYIYNETGESKFINASNDEILSYLKDPNYSIYFAKPIELSVSNETEVFTFKGLPTQRGGILMSYSDITFNNQENQISTLIFQDTTNNSNSGGALSFGAAKNSIFNTNVVFQNNKTPNNGGGAIFNMSDLYFNANALFGSLTDKSLGNISFSSGGAIFNYGKITFDQDSNTIFANNKSETSDGGAIMNSSYENFIGNIVFSNVQFNNNLARSGAALMQTLGFTYDEKTNNLTEYRPTTVFTSNTIFDNNRATAHGGAIYTRSNLAFNTGAISEFKYNTANGYGGAIFINRTTIYHTDENGVKRYLYDEDGNYRYIKPIVTFNDISTFKNNIAGQRGGAISNEGNITFNNESYFIGNQAIQHAGSMYNVGKVEFNDKSYFIGNSSSLGGAISNSSTSTTDVGEIIFNKNAMFFGNVAKLDTSTTWTLGRGGALFSWGNTTFNSDFVFARNKAIKGNDIYIENRSGTYLNFNGDEKTVGTIEGGIAGGQKGQINKTGTGLLVLGDQSENHEYEGAFTQTAGVTIANSEAFFSHELAQNTINGGELKTHGSEISYKATLGETGTLTHLGSSTDTPTEIKGVTFNGTGLNLTLGTYTKAEQEKEIALVGDRLVEYVDDKGTEDTSDDEVVSYQATDKLFTIKALENDQKAKFILKENLAGMEGNTLTIDNAELDVKEGLKVAGKVVAKDMRLPAEKTSSFTALEVAEKGLLDIKNQTVTADTLSLNQEGAVKVSVHSLSDYGQILAKETVSKGSGTLTMNLVGAPQEGVYKVFEQDTDLKLATTHEFLDITDLENGSYKIARKRADELAEKFGLNEEETRAVSAVIGGNSENEAFQKVQTEIMETLKSGNKGKAKKALSAVGAKEHPVEQSVASEHLVALQNVVQAELHGSTVGHSGGEEETRAKVYIKGLYDKTKSTMGDGFKARSQGAVLGVQSKVTDALTVGVGYATSQTTAKEELRRTEVDTNTGFISAHYQPNAWWLSGLATYSRGQYDEQKQVLSSVGTANYDVDSWGVQVMTGYDIKLDNMVVTPEVGLRYLSVKQEGYTDTLGTTVAGIRSDYLTALVGVKGTWDMGAIRPTAGVTVGYDVISDDVSALNTLANGASYTVNGEALDRLSTGVSLGVEADLGDRTTLKLEYSGTFRKEYQDHSGMLKFELRF
ncbi:MAG: autotransporter domain-containing protein [Alphaproteobacteria bacterium]|nr:autotransporter domain-containing protein [Alphaproteobacteria bacterium]